MKFTLVALANFAQDTGECYAAMGTLCELTAQHITTVRRALADLIQAGYVADTGRRRGVTGQVKVYLLPAAARHVAAESERAAEAVIKPPALTRKRRAKGERKESERAAEAVIKPPALHITETVNVNGEQEQETAVPSPHVQFKKLWAARFKDHYGKDYHFEGGKDAKGLDGLVKMKIPIAELIELAVRAWSAPNDKDHWACAHQSHTISKFFWAYNGIIIELSGRKDSVNPYQKPRGVVQDHVKNPW